MAPSTTISEGGFLASKSTASPPLPVNVLRVRGGSAPQTSLSLEGCFNRYFAGLGVVCMAMRVAARAPAPAEGKKKENKAWGLQWRFLTVFWVWQHSVVYITCLHAPIHCLLRCSLLPLRATF